MTRGTFGETLSCLRESRGYSQRRLAKLATFSNGYISQLENGIRIPTLESAAHLDQLLQAGGQLVRIVKELRLGSGHVGPAPMSSSATGTPQIQNPYSSAMQSFRAADKQVGGGHLYATVLRYLQAEVAPQLFGVHDDTDGQLAFTAAAALTEMAGWMAHDAGQDQAAEQHFARSLDLAKVGGDRQLAVHILASMSHLAHHLGKPTNAVQLALRGRRALARGPRHPELEARLFSMQARGLSSLGRADECTQLLIKAERSLAARSGEVPSQWVSRFDEGSLASEAARCLRQLGDLNEARRQAQRIVELRPDDRTRSRAFGQLILATVLIAQGERHEACWVAKEVLEATRQLGSYLVLHQILDVQRLLEPHRADTVVADFLECLDEALGERMGRYQWLARTTTPLGHVVQEGR